jgi:hypothetical protein
MSIEKRLEFLEARWRKPSIVHVHYEGGDPPCPACAESGPPSPTDSVVKVCYDKPAPFQSGAK